jgi:hypothetical protein
LHTGRNYIKQNERQHIWFNAWKKALQADYELCADGFYVRKLKFNLKDLGNIFGVLQYITKPPNIIYNPL